MKNSSKALFQSVVALILCVSMLVGTTFAWFTDSVTSGVNQILSGNLDVDLVDAAGNSLEGQPLTFRDVNGNTAILWEPGCTFKTQGFRVANKGSLALKYTMYINGLLGDSELLDVIDFRIEDAQGREVAIDDFVGHLSGNKSSGLYYLVGHMAESAGNEYQGLTLQGVGITVYATQATEESDSFDDTYDEGATFPTLKLPGSITAAVKSENGLVSEALTMADDADTLSAQIPAGVKLNSGVNELTLSVTEMTASGANIALQDDEILRSLDVHIEGVAADNTKPMQITIREAMMVGLNIGNYTLYHVENGTANAMTAVTALADLDAHNEFYYDPATGDVTLSLATFSEVAMAANTENAWNGVRDYSWYDASKTELTIANADQLAAFGAIVGGMDGQTQDSFAGKTVKLIADINLGDDEENNVEGKIFYPIGYYNNTGSYEKVSGGSVTSSVYSFEGTFDGNGNTISNFYQNTWEMLGDYNSGYSGTPNHYKDAMGLFGYVVNGKVCNLTVNNFSSDGEFTPTGVIAAYACNATFENIAITNCNPRVYNTGNGGIVGIGGNSDDPDTYKLTFTNITIDNSNIISALWGSWDVACGGLVGMFRGAGHVYMTNCHVGAQIDVYNDVCGNYQYYWYRYSGMMVGTNKNMITDDNGYTVPETDKFHAENCTVHFGDWNDYYYCELVANSLASYTHDHQFSRLTEISSLDEIKSGDTWTKTGNFLLISGETKTCYHIVKNSDGTLKQHLHADAGEETVDGETVLKEDKQIVYLPFNQLFTGYGWGVKHVPIYNDGTPNPFEGVTVLDRATANSVVKFEGKVTELANNKEYKLSDIFNLVDNGVTLVPGALTVTVTNVDENNPVSATIVYDRTNWENSMLTLTGTGEVKITIQDYYFCTPTTIEVTVGERQAEEKFDVVMNNGDFLHRVGNSGTVALDKLFKAKDGVTVGTISVTVEAVDGTGASGTYSNNAIQFNGTGVVKVTITDNDYCTPTELYLEVVDAVNAISATSATANNVVLLNDISGGFTVDNGYAFYGNGFKVTCSGKGYRLNYAGMYGGFIEVNNGGVLDNVQVFSDIYPVALLYSSEAEDYKNNEVSTTEKNYYNYQLSAVAITGNGSMITNSYVYGGRNNIYVGDGNVSIVNTTTENGVLANIQIKSSNASTVTLKDVTTIQNEVQSTYDTTKTMMGCGILVGDVTSVSNPKLIIEGNWNHYNWVTSTNATNTSNTYAKEIITNALSQTNYVHTNANDDETVNLGMIVLNKLTLTIDDQRTVKDNYLLSNVTMSLKDPDTGLSGNVEGQVYSVKAGMGDPDSTVSEYIPTKNLEYKPTATKDENVAGSYDSNDGGDDTRYCYWDGDVLKLMYKENESAFALDVAKLVSFTKFGYTLDASVVVTKNGTALSAVDGKVTFTDAGSYVITYTVTDPYNYNKDGSQVANATEWIFTYDVEVSVVKSVGKNAEINVTSTSFYGAYGKTSILEGTDYHYCIPFMSGVTITDYAEDGITASIFDATKNIISITIEGDKSSGTVTFTYLDGRELIISVSGHSVGLGSTGNTISVKSYNNQLWICTDGVSNNATTATWSVTSYKFTGNNGVPVEYTTTRTCNFDSASTTNSPQTSWSSYGSPSVDSIKYTVTYDANGGSCTKAFGYATSASAAVTLPTPTRTGYIFAGWYTEASGGTRVGGAGDSYTPSADITLYAQWGQPCTVTYNANGGSCGTPSEKYTGTALTLPTANRDGYWFIGWYDAATGGNKVGDAGATYNPGGDITLYAQWQEQVKYTVTYDANGGTCGTASATYEGTALTLPTPTRTGYTFNGWYTATSGGTKIGDAGATYTPSASVTLYAQWTAMPMYTITIGTQSNATVTVDKTSTYEGDTVTVTVTFSKNYSKILTVKDASGNTVLSKTAAGTYTFTMPASNVTIDASSSGSCVTPDTLVTLADGTQKRIDEVTYADRLLVWNFYTGEYDVAPASVIVNHGYDSNEIIRLTFSDGTKLNFVGVHGAFDQDLNRFVEITAENVTDFIGDKFLKVSDNGFVSVILVDSEIVTEYTESWSIVSVKHYNAILNGVLTVTPTSAAAFPALDMPQLAPYEAYELGQNMKYDEVKMQADIEKYGLYTYEEFADYCTYELFEAFDIATMKIVVGKGYATFEDVVNYIQIILAFTPDD